MRLWFDLAIKDGCTLNEAFRRYSPAEFLVWKVRNSIEPINKPARLEQLLGIIAYYQSLQLESKGKKPTVDDYVVDYWKSPQSNEELRANLFASLGVMPPEKGSM
ncbi:MAG: hypothetical protein DHS20C16_03570 [Phycisphaerae bacterium]|nr:MAG: hypothetical protein DHS20C16_03570 [Phycisphaerae bacterium]